MSIKYEVNNFLKDLLITPDVSLHMLSLYYMQRFYVLGELCFTIPIES
jgi:hypothetical protein